MFGCNGSHPTPFFILRFFTMTDFAALKNACADHIAAAQDLPALDEVRVLLLGKKGKITELLKSLASLPPETRKETGAAINALKEDITAAIAEKQGRLNQAALQARMLAEKVDVTLPVRCESLGNLHPIPQTIEEIVAIFADMGLKVAEGPDVESDFYNFTALNMPPDHPARQMQDSFYLPPRREGEEPPVLRTQTSPVQIRTMLTQQPPIRIIAPGRTFRNDYDQTHTPMFHQVEGLVLDETTHMGHLKGVLIEFLRCCFAMPDLPFRFRLSYFPFTEPSAEIDIGCTRHNGTLTIGGGKNGAEDWLEVLGCGMVHAKVLENCKIDSSRIQGFAFGMGVERLAMLKYGIPDLRTFFESDLRWLRHYGFSALQTPTLAGGI